VGPTYKIVNYETALHNKSEGRTPFDDLIEKLDIPNPAKAGHCTRDLKIVPIQKYVKEVHGLKVGTYWTATGIRADEAHRKSRNDTYIHPMMDLGFTEKHVRDFWSQQPFDLELKDYQGNCDLCFKKSLKKRMTIIKEDPECAEWWNKVEKASKKGYIFDRSRLTTETIIEMTKDYFKEAEDKHDLRQKEYAIAPCEFDEVGAKKTTIFDDLDLDFETDCFCKVT
jgi:3'-phosphoadenosine 5'-phosphosulfate sulfotransferase (PAPS reductase)/FAD synthetase